MSVYLQPVFDQSRFSELLASMPKKLDQVAVNILRKIGDEIIDGSYTQRGYGRITGRLQSSYAYVIVKDGKVLYERHKDDESDVATYPKNEKHMTPKQQMGVTFRDLLGTLPPDGYFLVIIAAMYYGLYVHSTGKMVMIPLDGSKTYRNMKELMGGVLK